MPMLTITAVVRFTTRNSVYSFAPYRGDMGQGWTLGTLTCESGTFAGLVVTDVEILDPMIGDSVIAFSDERQMFRSTPVVSVEYTTPSNVVLGDN